MGSASSKDSASQKLDGCKIACENHKAVCVEAEIAASAPAPALALAPASALVAAAANVEEQHVKNEDSAAATVWEQAGKTTYSGAVSSVAANSHEGLDGPVDWSATLLNSSKEFQKSDDPSEIPLVSESPFWTATRRSLNCGIVGAVVGAGFASVRDANAAFYMGAMGTNYFVMGLSYFSVLELAKAGLPKHKDTWELHAGVGAAVGTFMGLTFSGIRKLPQFTAVFALAGGGGFLAFQQFDRLRNQLASQRASEKAIANYEIVRQQQEKQRAHDRAETKGDV